MRRRNDKPSAMPPAKDAETGDVPVGVKSGAAEAGSDGRGDSGGGPMGKDRFLGPAHNSTTVLSNANSVLSSSVPTEGAWGPRGEGCDGGWFGAACGHN